MKQNKLVSIITGTIRSCCPYPFDPMGFEVDLDQFPGDEAIVTYMGQRCFGIDLNRKWKEKELIYLITGFLIGIKCASNTKEEEK